MAKSGKESVPAEPAKVRAIGSDFFKDLRLESDVFIDKSMLIKDALEDNAKVILVTRPRRWGKSANIDMLKTFLAIEVDEKGKRLPEDEKVNPKLFKGGQFNVGLTKGGVRILEPLAVATQSSALYEEELGQWPVVTINFKNIGHMSYQSVEDGLRTAVAESFSQHEYLLESDRLRSDHKDQIQKYLSKQITKEEAKDALKFLTDCLHRHFGKKVWVLIDEYDCAIIGSFLKIGTEKENPTEFRPEFEQVLDLFRGVMGSGLKTNEHLEKAFVTGIFRIAKLDLLSSVNNLTEYNLLNSKFAEHYGFSQKEVDYVLEQCHIGGDLREKVKAWYNGYKHGEVEVYNPWSVVSYLSSGQKQMQNFWEESGGFGPLRQTLLTDETQKTLQHLAKCPNAEVQATITSDINLRDIKGSSATMSLLLFAGYLSPIEVDFETKECTLSIPNQEVADAFGKLVQEWASNKLGMNTDCISQLNDLTRPLYGGDIGLFETKMQEFISENLNSRTSKATKESDYHHLMIGILAPMNILYYIKHEPTAGKGYADSVLVPKPLSGKDVAIIFEYKHYSTVNPETLKKHADEGLNQIDDKSYQTYLAAYPHVAKVIKIGMAFSEDNVRVSYQEQLIQASLGVFMSPP